MSEQKTLGEALSAEMARVNDGLLPLYWDAFPVGSIVVSLIRNDLGMAAKALASQDAPAMTLAYESLKGYEL